MSKSQHISPYWRYYDHEFDWEEPDHPLRPRPDYKQTHAQLVKAGLSDSYASLLIQSGYFSVEGLPGVVIDRYYGGLLASVDGRTRFRPEHLARPAQQLGYIPWVRPATSIADLRNIVEQTRRRTSTPLLFRGQTKHFSIGRPVPNPYFVVPGIGETSLVPSIWRRMLNKRPTAHVSFTPPILLEWSAMLLQDFDIEDIDRRVKRFADKGEYLFTYGDMEDCPDPVLAEFGKFSLDLSTGHEVNLADKLATCLQHYGLLSPVLDLTSSLDVALFFSSHAFSRDLASCRYSFVGTNNRESVIYILQHSSTEMVQPNASDEFVLRRCRPLRPERQECYVARSAPFALNLPGDFMVGIIRLDFDWTKYEGPEQSYLFPDASTDRFVNALRRMPLAAEYMTDFASDGGQ